MLSNLSHTKMEVRKYISILAILLYTTFFISGCGKGQYEHQQLPNIILIVSDDQGYNDIASYGATDILTPNLDKLCNDGVRLTNFYVTSSICTPSRSSLLTGRYPQRNGTYELFRNELPDVGHKYIATEYSTTPERILGTDLREKFLSEFLQEAGYVNGIFGKWDLGQLKRYLPLQQGFHSFYGFANTGIDYFTHERYGVPSMFRNNEPTKEDSGQYCTGLFEREALAFLDQHHDKPFFIYLPFNAPHSASNLDPKIRSSVQAPKEYLNMYAGDSSSHQEKRRGYKAAVTAMDVSMGNILGQVKAYGLEENTMVIFLSDNGGGIGSDNAPYRGGKSHFLEGGVRVPCIIKWPGRIKPGTENNEFLSSLEILPTVLAACDITPPNELILDGFDMLPVLKGTMPSKRNTLFWELRGGYAARVNNYKWVDDMKGNVGLYDLSKDAGEAKDLGKTHEEQLRIVKKKFRQWQKEMAQAEDRGPFKDF